MSSAEGMPLPPGVRPDEVRAWACTYLEEGGGDAARKRVSTASPEGGSKLAAWNRGLAVAVNPATRQVQFGRDIQPGWTLRQCRTDKAGESCRFLRDRLRKPVSLSTHRLDLFLCRRGAPTGLPATGHVRNGPLSIDGRLRQPDGQGQPAPSCRVPSPACRPGDCRPKGETARSVCHGISTRLAG